MLAWRFMQGRLILVEGKRLAELTETLAELGFGQPVARAEQVRGGEVVMAAQALQDERPASPLELMATTEDSRWTVLSDLTGGVFDELDAMRELSARIDGRVVLMELDDEAPALTWFASGVLRRHLEQTDEGLAWHGEALPLEALFGSSKRLAQADLLGLLQGLGLDPGRLNSRASYTVLAY